MKIEVQDYDGPGKFDLIGTIETTVGNIVGSKDFTFNGDLHKNSQKAIRGHLTARVSPVQESNFEVILKLSARRL